ncbi:MAG TPA: exodeoxyribonuclease III [Allosphingosinicella sp.]|nr:exodeoxyribonuclease III [Allosphingosinicella sp.]
MRIASFNINNIRRRLPNLLDWLRGAKPDVCCLQELKASDREFPADALRKAGYEAVWRGEKTWNGVAILARGVMPVVTRTELPGDPDDTQSRYIEAAVNGVLIASLYAPNGNPQPGPKFDYKRAWNERLIARAAELVKLGEPVVLAGDYNIIPTPTAIDAHKPERWMDDALMQPEPQAQYERLVAQGWTDSLRHLHPGKPIFTFWDYWRNAFARNAGIRIDHLLLNPAAAKRLKSAGVDREARAREKASDHAPTWVELK